MKKVKKGKLEVKGDIFIIPNPAPRTGYDMKSNPLLADKYQKEMECLLTAAGVASPFGNDIVMLQVWIVSDDLETTNLADHGAHFKDETDTERRTGSILSYVPAAMFEGQKEGDIVNIIVPKGMYKMNPNFEMVLHLRLAQKDYRYRRFGTFEQVYSDIAGPANRAAAAAM